MTLFLHDSIFTLKYERIIYDKGEVDPFVRACFVEECAGEPPSHRFALKLLASRDLEVLADGPNMVDVQTFTLEEPMLLPKGCFVGVYQRTFPPRLQYQTVWPRGEPFRYGVFIGLPNGAQPNEVGDVVHRCTKSEECPGLSISVKHFDSIEALEAARDSVKEDNTRTIECRRRLMSEKAGKSLHGSDGREVSSESIAGACDSSQMLVQHLNDATPNMIETYMGVETRRDEDQGEEKIGAGELDPYYDPDDYSRMTHFGPGGSI